MKKRALITGITGQDGAYLAKLLLEKNYEVYGSYRRSSLFNLWRLEALGIADQVHTVEMEILEFSNVMSVIKKIRPDEIYNLAAQSFVSCSFDQPIFTSDTNALGPLRILEAIRMLDMEIRFYQASSSEMFGKVQEPLQSETTPFYPRSPYGVSKLYAHWITVNYRESYNIKASSGILYNHESPLRGLEFVTRKITHGLSRIKYNQQDVLELGNLDAKRDWGFAGDYVQGIWLMLQQDVPGDYVVATGQTHSVRDFSTKSAAICGFDLEWAGAHSEEKGIDRKTGKTIIRVNPELYRPAEVDVLTGNSAKACKELGWKPETSYQKLIEIMIEADLARAADKRNAA